MPFLVIIFFLFTTLSVLATGYLLPRHAPGPAVRRFGNGLMFGGIAFAIWSIAVVMKPVDTLSLWMTAGLLFLLPGLLLFISASTAGISPQGQRLALGAGVVWSLLYLGLRTVYPANPHFSSTGLFYFGLHPYVKFVTISLLTAALVPATWVVGRELAAKSVLESRIFVSAAILELVGCILLLSNEEDPLMFLVGWAMGVGFLLLVLLAAGAFSRVPIMGAKPSSVRRG